MVILLPSLRPNSSNSPLRCSGFVCVFGCSVSLITQTGEAQTDGLATLTVPSFTSGNPRNNYGEKQKSKGVHKPYQVIVKEAFELWKKMSAEEKEPYGATYLKELEIFRKDQKIVG
ncbi:uncharacterized protein LOC132278887 [Cornus florida]|uniref:uncharacterized protein LOC132278887 n=1 Tax=Cornus florida TaxID=4283 RepID=UPI00289DEFDA|nr:uncharacterized protein LOC132278887 [Cornus florida]